MEFSRPEYWSGQPFPSSGNLPNPRIKPRSPALQADSLPAEPQGKQLKVCILCLHCFVFHLLNFPVIHFYWILQRYPQGLEEKWPFTSESWKALS